MDYIDQIFDFLPLPMALIVMGLSFVASKNIERDAKGRLPNWFLWIPLGVGMALGVIAYLIGKAEAALVQPGWLTVAKALLEGFKYGSGGVLLWSARRLVPFFKRIEANGSSEEPPTQSQGGTS